MVNYLLVWINVKFLDILRVSVAFILYQCSVSVEVYISIFKRHCNWLWRKTFKYSWEGRGRAEAKSSYFLIQEDRQSQILPDNLYSDLFPINELHRNFEIKLINCFLMPAQVKLKDTRQFVSLGTSGQCVHTNVPSLQLLSQILWPAFRNSLACSRLLALSILEAEERDGKGLVAGGVVLPTCRSLFVWLAARPPADALWASLAVGRMPAQPQNGRMPSLPSPRVTGRELHACPTVWVETRLPHRHLQLSLPFGWRELVRRWRSGWLFDNVRDNVLVI